MNILKKKKKVDPRNLENPKNPENLKDLENPEKHTKYLFKM
jgi:hypothetical protein